MVVTLQLSDGKRNHNNIYIYIYGTYVKVWSMLSALPVYLVTEQEEGFRGNRNPTNMR